MEMSMSSSQKQPSTDQASDAPRGRQWEDNDPSPFPEPEIDGLASGLDSVHVSKALYDYRAEIRKATKGYVYKPEPTPRGSKVEKIDETEAQANPIEDHQEELSKAKKTSYSYSYTKPQESPRPPSPSPAPPRHQAPRDKPKKARTRDSEFYFSTSGPSGTTHIINCGPGASITNIGNSYAGATVINGDRVTTFSDDGTSQTTFSTGPTFQRFSPGGARTFHFQAPGNVVVNDDGTWVQSSDGAWTCYPQGMGGTFTASSPRMGGRTRSRGAGSSGAGTSRR